MTYKTFCYAVAVLLLAGCARDIEIFSYVSIHKNIVLVSNNNPVSISEYTEDESSFTSKQDEELVMVRPKVNELSLTVQFPNIPALSQTVNYVEDLPSGREFNFAVFEAVPFKKIDVKSYSASLTRLNKVILDEEVEDDIIAGDAIKEKLSFSYIIQWDDSELHGEIYMVRTSHFEPGPLLN